MLQSPFAKRLHLLPTHRGEIGKVLLQNTHLFHVKHQQQTVPTRHLGSLVNGIKQVAPLLVLGSEFGQRQEAFSGSPEHGEGDEISELLSHELEPLLIVENPDIDIADQVGLDKPVQRFSLVAGYALLCEFQPHLFHF